MTTAQRVQFGAGLRSLPQHAELFSRACSSHKSHISPHPAAPVGPRQVGPFKCFRPQGPKVRIAYVLRVSKPPQDTDHESYLADCPPARQVPAQAVPSQSRHRRQTTWAAWLPRMIIIWPNCSGQHHIYARIMCPRRQNYTHQFRINSRALAHISLFLSESNMSQRLFIDFCGRAVKRIACCFQHGKLYGEMWRTMVPISNNPLRHEMLGRVSQHVSVLRSVLLKKAMCLACIL